MSRRGWQHLQCLYENSYKNMCKKIHHFPQIHKSTSFHDDNSTQTSIRQSSKRKKKSIWKLLFCACFHRHLCTHCVCMHDMNSLWIYDFHNFLSPFLPAQQHRHHAHLSESSKCDYFTNLCKSTNISDFHGEWREGGGKNILYVYSVERHHKNKKMKATRKKLVARIHFVVFIARIFLMKNYWFYCRYFSIKFSFIKFMAWFRKGLGNCS